MPSSSLLRMSAAVVMLCLIAAPSLAVPNIPSAKKTEAPKAPPVKVTEDTESSITANTQRAMRIAVPKTKHVDQSVTSVSEAITGKDEETFTHLLGMFDHDDDGKLTFDELVDIKKALDTLTSFAEKGPKGIKPSLPLPDLIKSGGVIELETKRLEEKNGDKGVQITYGMFEDRFSQVLADTGAVFKKLDGNEDKELSDSELQDLVTYMPDHLSYLQFSKWYHLKLAKMPDGGDALFDELDVDNDDQVTHDELMKMHKHDKKERKKGMEVAGFKEMFGDILAEHSKLSVEELFKLADVNFNGALDHREVVAVEIMIADAIDGTLKFESNPHKANQLRKGRFAGAVAIDSAEFTTLFMHHFPKEKLETVFKALDANSDGKVDPEEVKKVKEHQPKEWAQPEFTAWFFDKFKDIDQLQKTFVLMDGDENKILDAEEVEFIQEDLDGPAMVPVDHLMHDPWMGMSFKAFDHRYLNNLVGCFSKKEAHKTLDKDGNGILTRSEIHKIGEVLPESMNYSAFEYWHEERMYMGGAVPARGFNDEEMQYQFKDIDMNDDKILTKDELVLYATPSKAERDQYRDYARRAIKGQTFGHFDPLGLLGDAHDPDAVHDPTQGVGMFQFMHHIAPHLALKDGRADMIFHVLDKDQDMHLSPTELQQIKEYFHEL